MNSKVTIVNYSSKNFPDIDITKIQNDTDIMFQDSVIFQHTNMPIELLALDQVVDKKINVIFDYVHNTKFLQRCVSKLKNINLYSNPHSAMLKLFIMWPNTKENVDLISTDFVETAKEYQQKEFFQIKNHWNPTSQKFLCLNKRQQFERPIILSGLLSHGISGLFTCDIDMFIIKRDIEYFEQYATYHRIDNWFEEFLKQSDRISDPNTNKLTFDQMYSDIKLEVVNETFFFDHFFSPSEKVIRPMIKGVPFILCAPPKSLHMLRSVGFKTFDPIIDESYDLEINPFQRIVSCVSSAFKFYNKRLTPEEIDQIRSIISHNQKIVSNLTDLVKNCLTEYKKIIPKQNKQSEVEHISITCSATEKNSFITCNGMTKQLVPSLPYQTFCFPVQEENFVETKNCFIRSLTMNDFDLTSWVKDNPRWKKDILPDLINDMKNNQTQSPNIYSHQYLYDTYN